MAAASAPSVLPVAAARTRRLHLCRLLLPPRIGLRARFGRRAVAVDIEEDKRTPCDLETPQQHTEEVPVEAANLAELLG